MLGRKATGTLGYLPFFEMGHFWRHTLHPLRNIKARLRKIGPLNYTSKMGKAEHKLEDLKKKAIFYEERLNRVKSRIRFLEAKVNK